MVSSLVIVITLLRPATGIMHVLPGSVIAHLRITQDAPTPNRDAEELDVCEAIFRHQFKHNCSEPPNKGFKFFLAVKGDDPARDFIRRFASVRRIVTGQSQFKEKQGAKFSVDSITWLDETTAEVKGIAPHCPTGSVYRVERKPAGWSVERDEILEIYESLFRHQFDAGRDATQKRAGTYFLEIANADPAPSFLKRFEDGDLLVDLASKFSQGSGTKYSIRSLKWLDGESVEASGGHHRNGKDDSGHDYRLEKKDGKWRVTEDKLKWVS